MESESGDTADQFVRLHLAQRLRSLNTALDVLNYSFKLMKSYAEWSIYTRIYVKAGWKVKVATQHSNEIKKFVRLHQCILPSNCNCNGRDGYQRKLGHRIDQNYVADKFSSLHFFGYGHLLFSTDYQNYTLLLLYRPICQALDQHSGISKLHFGPSSPKEGLDVVKEQVLRGENSTVRMILSNVLFFNICLVFLPNSRCSCIDVVNNRLGNSLSSEHHCITIAPHPIKCQVLL